ncbi:MAG: hypothetical protein AAGG56_10150 [Pseudomonadota bacterium]
MALALGAGSAILSCDAVWADAPVVEGVSATRNGDTWRFDVTVSHADEGWEHYADAWEVIGPDGQVLGTRTLFHPHVTEQPFTRSLSQVVIPDGVTQVQIRAHDSVHGWGDPIAVDLLE